jgi:hypothetical protein
MALIVHRYCNLNIVPNHPGYYLNRYFSTLYPHVGDVLAHGWDVVAQRGDVVAQ